MVRLAAALGLMASCLCPGLAMVEDASGLAADCDLAPWVAETAVPGETGFHVLCVLDDSRFLLYKGGVMTQNPSVLALDEDFRETLEKELEPSSIIKYDIADQTTKKPVRWTKQPWTVYTSNGQELRVGGEAATLAKSFASPRKPAVLLMFEGGAWRWPTIAIGYQRKVMKGVTLTTVSRIPALFNMLLDKEKMGSDYDQLTPLLLSNVVDMATPRLSKSQTEGKVIEHMRSSEQTFVSYNENDDLKKLRAATAKLLRGPEENLEHLQVVRYNKNQHYDAHRDYWDPREFPDVPRFQNKEGYWHQRMATLLWYLEAPEAGGETWFPRAHGGPIPHGEWTACDDRGAKVSPANATAILFYSLQADGNIDEYSWHCGCPVKEGTKWAANSWMRNSPEGYRPAKRRPLEKGAKKTPSEL